MLPVPAIPSAENYRESDFLSKLSRFGRTAGSELIEKALWLYFAAKRPETPKWATATAYGALAYFVLPADMVPDITPFGGYADDLGVLVFSVATIATYIDDHVKSETEKVLSRWLR
jgi:uncharacterized membrane protein YkvA (DUF1232 family)